MDSHQGEIVLKEKYGATAKERFYVKPSGQLHVVEVKDGKFADVAGIFTKIFLPQGYPGSVSKDYIAYQMWDTFQAFCSTIISILAMQEVLKGVGVGDTSATPLAATITWVVKEGCGHLGRILFAYSHGSQLDSYSKRWRLYADILNDAGMCIEMALSLFPNYISVALCVSTLMKSIVGVAGSATRAAMTQHQALRGNMADLSAKDSAQETAVNLIASVTALFIISFIGNSLSIFFIMLTLHIVFNYFAVRAVCLKTLNEPRFLQVLNAYLQKEIIANPCEINHTEPIVFYQHGSNLFDLKLCGFRIKMGHSITQLTNNISKAMDLQRIKGIYMDKKYILFPNTNNKVMYVFLKERATVDDILCAYFEAYLLAIITCFLNDQKLPIVMTASFPRPFADVCKTIQSSEWSRASGKGSGFTYEPSDVLLLYISDAATREWKALRRGLILTGWDLEKHLLIVDEWRICDETKYTDDKKDSRYDEPSSKKSALNEKQLDELLEKDSCVIEPEESSSKNTERPTRMMRMESEAVEKKRVVKE